MSKPDDKLFSQHEHALEKEYELCPLCGNELVIKNSKAGAFFGCSTYPSCEYTRPVVEHERVEDKILMGSECPKCQSQLAVKQGRYGMFIGCSNFPQCRHIEETHHHEDAGVACPKCTKGQLIERTNRYGKTFYSCEQYPKCKFIVNNQPVKGVCQQCGFSLLLKRQMAAGEKLQCAQKKCGHFQS
ncbi:DNA topoisomerase family protein [Thalassotalea piscium]|uniref:Putative DNA topoisomerase n=1 Tax=Thalassotalea piscium TaxID=1230533 RepID=A0A7X0NHI2_9GAMM|nr:topoisomerase DNA-binding C4 zinc finger domain-containing protein [Thalassotalea piscium]MBB6543543.1 putative DNA topoisomerase [Thalassotalea piscium]